MLLLIAGPWAYANTIQGVRTHEAPDYIRVVLDTSKTSVYSVFSLTNPDRIVIDVKNAEAGRGLVLHPSRARRLWPRRAL